MDNWHSSPLCFTQLLGFKRDINRQADIILKEPDAIKHDPNLHLPLWGYSLCSWGYVEKL